MMIRMSPLLLVLVTTTVLYGCSNGDDDTTPSASATPVRETATPTPGSGLTATPGPAETPTPGPVSTPGPTSAVTPTPETTPAATPTPAAPTGTPEPEGTPTPAAPTGTPEPEGTPTPWPPTPAEDGDDDGFPLSEDCDDGDPSVHPGAPEQCDGVDNDCDGDIDEDVQELFFADEDGDGYGVESSTTWSCILPEGYAAVAGDCDDQDPAVHPGAEEVCDGRDNDCDVDIDEQVLDLFYVDGDGDGYGTEQDAVQACDAPEGYVLEAGDCDDTDPQVNPGASEVCNGEDDDCDGTPDDGLTVWTFYPDGDGDGFGAGVGVEDCAQPEGYVRKEGDCDDADPAVYPGAEEVCDGVDNDCDGVADHLQDFFRDDFDGKSLDPCWEIVSPNPDSSVQLDEANGVLVVRASPKNGGSDYFGTTNYDAPRVLYPVPEGDWTVAVKLRFDPTRNYEGAGIFICFAEGGDEPCWRVAERAYYPAGGGEVVHSVGDYVRYGDPDVWLKVEKRGTSYTGWYRAPGSDTWVENGTKTRTGVVEQVGVFAIRQPWDDDFETYAEAAFDWFELSP